MKTLADKFWERVNKTDRCWLWTGGTYGRKGAPYGRFSTAWRRAVPAHRWIYEQTIGPIPQGLTIDHVCRTTLCVRMDHLRLLTPGDNMRDGASPPALNHRRTHCIHGHPLSGDNLRTYVRDGRLHRMCVTCKYASQDRRAARIYRRQYRKRRMEPFLLREDHK